MPGTSPAADTAAWREGFAWATPEDLRILVEAEPAVAPDFEPPRSESEAPRDLVPLMVSVLATAPTGA